MMVQSDDMEKPNFADDYRKIRILSFASHRSALLYSGQKEEFDNWALASSFAMAHGMIPIEQTEGGLYLSTPDRKKELKYTPYELQSVWDRASIKYCISIEGSIKTFVCGTWDQSTFRRKEIHALLRSKTVDDINGRDHADYVRLRRAVLARLNEQGDLPQPERHKRSMNAVFRAVALQEIRQDLAVARLNEKLEEVPSILVRVRHLREQQREDLQYAKRLPEVQKLTEKLSAEEEMARANPHLHTVMFGHRYAHG